MGGNAFASLFTPRMPPEIYEQTKARIHEILAHHFIYVGSPIEAPGKSDHGDIDFLVAEPRSDEDQNSRLKKLVEALGAVQTKRNGPTTYLAIPWPGSDRLLTSDLDASTPTDENGPARYIQVDVHMCLNAEDFHWHMFFLAHGDLWSMVGGMIRSFGFTCSVQGMFLRIPEIEQHNRTLSRVKLSDNPEQILAYLGLDERQYWSEFNSWDDMMGFVASCRFHDPTRRKKKLTAPSSSSTSDNEDSITSKPQSNTMSFAKDLKSNERQRVRKRPLFNHFITVYLPAHVTGPPGVSSHLTRDEVINDAKSFFGPSFAETFDKRRREGIRELGTTKLFSELRRELPITGNQKGWVMKGLRREIIVDWFPGEIGGSDQLQAEHLSRLTDVQKMYLENRFDEVKEWARRNYRDVGARQKVIDDEGGRKNLMAKVERNGSSEGLKTGERVQGANK